MHSAGRPYSAAGKGGTWHLSCSLKDEQPMTHSIVNLVKTKEKAQNCNGIQREKDPCNDVLCEHFLTTGLISRSLSTTSACLSSLLHHILHSKHKVIKQCVLEGWPHVLRA